jgi:curved DNA-binding protein CbpA
MKWTEKTPGWKNVLHEARLKTPHEMLGVAPDATRKEIRAAYLRLVKLYHPDKSDQFMGTLNEEMLKLINSAYERLKQAERPDG